ncbi:MAG: hypothetical protein EBV83_07400 [Verrucomicrobia bacterium]|nr:hypothetical protein [Verrucomicrobiota bacterium]
MTSHSISLFIFILIFFSNPVAPCFAGEEDNLADFTAGAYHARGTTFLSKDIALTRNGTIFQSGDIYRTPQGTYFKSGDTYTGTRGTTFNSGDAFVGNRSTTFKSGDVYLGSQGTTFRSGDVLLNSSHNRSSERSDSYARQEAENNAWEARQWKDVETVAGAFVASGPYYKAGQRCVNTDKGLVYSTGNGCVVAPDGFYYRSGNLWVGPNGKLAAQSGSGNNRYLWGNDGDSAISSGRGYFTERGYSWPAYTEPVTRPVSATMRKP